MNLRLLIFVLAPQLLVAQGSGLIGGSLRGTAARLAAGPERWPVIGFVELQKPNGKSSRFGPIVKALNQQIAADYSDRILDGELSPVQERYYADISSVLYSRGGYTNWYVGQILDARAAYSLVRRVYLKGVVTDSDADLVKGLGQRTLTLDLLLSLIAQEVDVDQAENLRKLSAADAMERATELIVDRSGGIWPPMIESDLLQKKNLAELIWRLRIHSNLVRLEVAAFVDAAPRIRNWEILLGKDLAAAVLQNVDPKSYRALGIDRLEEADIRDLLALITGATEGSRRVGRALRGLKP
jgi:hypothetical protein